jgi:hypothetical protein
MVVPGKIHSLYSLSRDGTDTGNVSYLGDFVHSNRRFLLPYKNRGVAAARSDRRIVLGCMPDPLIVNDLSVP